MAPRGIGAFVFVVSLIFSMTILGGVGFYGAMGISIDVEGQNEDVQQAAAELNDINYGEGRSSSILEGPLAAVTPVVNMVLTLKTVIANTSGVLQLLYGIPKVAADAIELLFRIALLITIAYIIRSGSPV